MVAVGSGLGAQFGVIGESAFGTPTGPVSKFFEVDKVDLKKIKNTSQGGGLAAGRMAQLGIRRKVTTTAASGTVTMDVTNKLMGLLLQALCGTSVTPVIVGAGPGYTQTHALAVDTAGKSLTMQVGVPMTDATTAAMTYKGCKILSAEFTCETDGILKVTFEIDARELDEATALATASYSVAASSISWALGALKIGALGSETQVQGVKSFSVKIERSMKVDRFYVGSGGKKAEPITNDWLKVSGTFNADFMSKADFSTRFHDDTSFSTIWEFIGPAIAGGAFETFRIAIPMAFLDGDTPGPDGPDVVSGAFPFTALLDGTNPLATITTVSTDVTL